MNLGDIKKIHFVGIGGIGMSGIAEILVDAGVVVSGCDLRSSATTDLLSAHGIPVSIGHDPAHLDHLDVGVDAVVVTAAVKGRNEEIEAARARGIRVILRAEMLGALVNDKRAVGVSGTHGKTTTSAMIATVLEEAGLDPTILVGGMLRNFDSNSRTGSGEFVVVEADEYARTFHHLRPEIAVVTNIEADHLEYYGSFEAIVEAFRIFVAGVKDAVVACIDDVNVAKLIEDSIPSPGPALRSGPPSPASGRGRSGSRPLPLAGEGRREASGEGMPHVITYGLSESADVRAVDLRFSESGTTFDVPGVGFFKLFVPGEHNVRNALAAIAVGRRLGIATETIAAGLARFLGVDRRFQILGEYAGAIVVDDYAHHPTEIRATLDAARRGFPTRRIVALFQPHLFSRTIDFAREFAEALRVADVSLVAPIYAAREQPVEGVSARLISDAASGIEFLDRSNIQIVNELRRRLTANDLFITMGAGDVHEVAEMLVRGTAA